MNEAFVNTHEIIEVVARGDQTCDTVCALAQKSRSLILEQPSDKSVVGLLNLLEIGKITPEARQCFVDNANIMLYKKLAIVGDDAPLRLSMNILIQAIGKTKSVKYFDVYDDAIEWLKGK